MYRIIATRGAEEIVTEAPLDRLPALLAEPDTHVWIDLSTPTSEADLAIVRDIFKFHPLAIEDCFESRTHPKIEEYEGYLYLITHGLAAGSTAEAATVVELDAFVGTNYIVTHHATQSRSVAGVREVVLRTGLPLRRGWWACCTRCWIGRWRAWKRPWTASRSASPTSRMPYSRAPPTATWRRCWR